MIGIISMLDQILWDIPTDRIHSCPRCGSTLYSIPVVEEQGELNWVETWHCPNHGPVELEANQGAKAQPGN
jgi:hypothetical protein